MSEEKVVNTLNEFLKKMELKFKYDKKARAFFVPFRIDDRDFMILITIRGKWITTASLIVRNSDLPPDLNREEFYARLLKETFYLNEVTYGLTKDNDVVVHAETHVDALSFENFKTEFWSVVYGIKHFLDRIFPEYPSVKLAKPEAYYIL